MNGFRENCVPNGRTDGRTNERDWIYRTLSALPGVQKLRNEIVALTRTKRKQFYKNYFEENNKNLRKVWQGIRQIINVKSKQSDIPTSITVNNKQITNPKDISNSFNNYYSNVAENILKKIESMKDTKRDMVTLWHTCHP